MFTAMYSLRGRDGLRNHYRPPAPVEVMRFTTVTGSVYEIDPRGRRIRRLTGTGSPTRNQGEDGEWKSFLRITRVVPGEPVLIQYRIDRELLEDHDIVIIRQSVTSPVRMVLELN